MRLKKIRIAGFKSFVDPITIDLHSNRVGILGPNGCGKSNVIDAVRWVLGESSAKYLRGQSMEDVIFNGSQSRKPIGQASVELIFDNSSGKLGGLYTSFSEIAIKRTVGRDGVTKYFLNGSRCRRRDITDIFLGTGLGPRSYAIIEQGMISRLIEAKPEELRNMLEEAAGISRYKERRRETETKLRQTRQNLERLQDLQDELKQQFDKLQRQAKTAKRFQTLRQEIKINKAWALLLWDEQLSNTKSNILKLKASETDKLDTLTAQIQKHEAQLIATKNEQQEAQTKLDHHQEAFYQAGAEMNRLEHQLNQTKQQKTHLQDHLTALNKQHNLLEKQQKTEQQSQQDNLEKLDNLTKQLSQLEKAVGQAKTNLEQAEADTSQWQTQWQTLLQQLAKTEQAQLNLQQQRQQLEKDFSQLNNQAKQLQSQQQETQSITVFEQDPQAIQNQIQQLEAEDQDTLSLLNTALQEQQSLKTAIKDSRLKIEDAQASIHQRSGELTALKVLSKQSAPKNTSIDLAWLESNQIEPRAKLTDQLEVEPGFETAIEAALQGKINSYLIPKLDAVTKPGHSGTIVFEAGKAPNPKQSHPSLADKLLAPQAARILLDGFFLAKDLNTAIKQRHALALGEHWISPCGHIVGRHILISPNEQPQLQPLSRASKIKTLELQLKKDNQRLDKHQQKLTTLLAEQAQLEERQKTLYQDQQSIQQAVRKHRAQQQMHHEKQMQQASTLTQLRQAIESNQAQLAHTQERLTDNDSAQKENQKELNDLNTQKSALKQSGQTLQQAKAKASKEENEANKQLMAVKFEIDHLKSSQANSQSNNAHLTQQSESTLQQIKALMKDIESLPKAIDLQKELDQAITQRVDIEQILGKAKEDLGQVTNTILELEQKKAHATSEQSRHRDALQTLQLDEQRVDIEKSGLDKQLQELGLEIEALNLADTPFDTPENAQIAIASLEAKVQQLGAINLTALDELTELESRRSYYEQQHADLTEAIDTLETAIKKIDKETRSRFKDTFEAVNKRIGELFPRLFGAGHCHLELTDTDILSTGVSIMAQPPGKRVSNIQLLSGGEKALTAIAMVFAIFELNPAPFCMLDEVDAPLDEANVGRFSNLLSALSNKVQFIFITHNKTTMELADHLIGVTMREPGVSRLVGVDLNAAMDMVQEASA